LEIFNARPLNPWNTVLQQVNVGSLNGRILISGAIGTELFLCARNIHDQNGINRPFIRVDCVPNDRILQDRMVGTLIAEDEYEVETFEASCPVLDSVGGTLVLDSLNNCNEAGRVFINTLLSKGLRSGGRMIKFDESTIVIGLITDLWNDDIDNSLNRIFTVSSRVPSLTAVKMDIPRFLAWFIAQNNPSIKSLNFDRDVWELVCGHPWPGDRKQLRAFAAQISGKLTPEAVVKIDMCTSISETGSKQLYKNEYFRKELASLAVGMTFRGTPVSAKYLYHWVSQIAQIADDPGQQPWEVGFTVIKAISQRYFYNHDKIAALLIVAFENFKKWLTSLGIALPEIKLIDTEMGFKSPSAMGRSIFLTADPGLHIERLPLSKIDLILQGEQLPLLIFADDFVGTGDQVSRLVIEPIIEIQKSKVQINANNPLTLVLLFAVGYDRAIDSLKTMSTDELKVVPFVGQALTDLDRAFTPNSNIFPMRKNRKKARRLLTELIGKSLYPECPKGFGDCESLVILTDNTPDNTLPAISRSGVVKGFSWDALFERKES